MSEKKVEEENTEDQHFDEDLDAALPGTAYDREMSANQLESYIDDIADTVRVGLDQSISILTPWFFNNMPKIYYQTTPRQEKVRHLSAIITGHVFETKQTVELWDRNRSKVTYIGPGGDRKILEDMASKISHLKVKMGGVYFSRDRLLFLSTFFLKDSKSLDMENHRIAEKVKVARQMMEEDFPDSLDLIDQYTSALDNEFVMYATVPRLRITFRMVRHMVRHEGAHSFLEPFKNSSSGRLTLGFKNTNIAEAMESVLDLIHRYDFQIGRAFVIQFNKGYDEEITVMHFILTHDSGEKVTRDFVPSIRMVKALRTLGWVDSDEYSGFARAPHHFSINASNLVRSMATWCHIFLSKKTPYAYSMYRVRNSLFQNPDFTNDLVNLFRLKFDPLAHEKREDTYNDRKEELQTKISALIEEIDRSIFSECIRFIDATLRTNYFLSTKTGHAFRMDPNVLHEKYYPHLPFGFYFISGRNFRAFQVRWKDVARGGMRVVMPRNPADYDYALAGIFDEVYGLSFAQQLKNKDIPEGGSKAVLVLKPGGHRDQAVKSCVNALLDLLVDDDESHEGRDKMVSYYDRPELIYLGPDENITNELINWIPEQAKRRHYKYWAAFMSSKPGAGINHKEYGVTSEGVNVYVENMLNYMGINPRQKSFTVKLTGGPDGDVAGNELKILYREYGENAKVVAIADGFGCAADRDGLDWKELLRLVHENKSIVEFDSKKIKSNAGFVLAADNNKNILIRNGISFKEQADVFIPAGGRPYTVNSKTWEQFLDDDGKPTMRAVVEGANIYFTESARTELQSHGVLMIKDSSANKTGVICSSYEIIASLTMSPEEFAEIKEKYVEEVIIILRNKADAEAKLLFRELSKNNQKTLVELSLEMSREVNALTDILLDQFEKDPESVIKDPLYEDIILRHCPRVLVAKYKDRIMSRLPSAHLVAIAASFVASYVVYREGLAWLKTIPEVHWSLAMKTYMEKDRMAHDLRTQLDGVEVESLEPLQEIISRSAARDLTVMELQKKKILS